MTATQAPCPACRGQGVIHRYAGNQPVALRCATCQGSGVIQVHSADDGTTISEFLNRFGQKVFR